MAASSLKGTGWTPGRATKCVGSGRDLDTRASSGKCVQTISWKGTVVYYTCHVCVKMKKVRTNVRFQIQWINQRQKVLKCIATRGFQLDGLVVRIQSSAGPMIPPSPTGSTRSGQEKSLRSAVQVVTE